MTVSKKVDLTQLVEELGGFGRYQVLVFILGCYASAMAGMLVVSLTFVGFEPDYRCLVPSCDDPSNPSFNESFLNFTTPYDEKKDKWDKCHTFELSSEDGASCSVSAFNPEKKENCSQYVYDTSMFKSSTVTEFDLVCGRAWLQPTASAMYMVGMMLGAFILGDLGDRIGRRKGIVICAVIFITGPIVSALSRHYYVFLASRIILGAGSVGMFQITFILVVEYFAPRWRTFVGILIEIPFALGEASIAILAYYIRDWRWLQAACIAPSFLLLLYWWLMPESFRWLISKGQIKEAKKVLKRIERVNKVTISSSIYEAMDHMDASKTASANEISGDKAEETSSEPDRKVMDLFRYPNTRKRTFNLIFSWAVVTITYYGLSLNSAHLGGDLFVNFVAIMLIEVPSYIFAYLVLDRLGRKGTFVFVMLLGGAASLLSAVTPSDMRWLIVTFSMTGKFGVSAGFAVIYIYTAEIFPTAYRSLGLGSCSMSARVGGILAPFVANLGKLYRPLPLIIFGVLALVSGFITLFLPETLGSELPQTLQEGEQFGVEQSAFYFSCCTQKKKLKLNSTK